MMEVRLRESVLPGGLGTILLLLTTLRSVLLMHLVGVLVGVQASAGAAQEGRLAQLLRVLRGRRSGSLIRRLNHLTLHELLLLRLAVASSARVQISTALMKLLSGSLLYHTLLELVRVLERLSIELVGSVSMYVIAVRSHLEVFLSHIALVHEHAFDLLTGALAVQQDLRSLHTLASVAGDE